mgnify:CR=1 FL=1
MKKLVIEWKHLDVEGETCERCYDTGENLANEVRRLNRQLQPRGITVEILETKLDDTRIPESNMLLFDGVPIENILDMKVEFNLCSSCSSCLDTDTECRTVFYDGSQYDDIPAKAIRHATLKVLGLEKPKVAEAEDCGCDCSKGRCC